VRVSVKTDRVLHTPELRVQGGWSSEPRVGGAVSPRWVEQLRDQGGEGGGVKGGVNGWSSGVHTTSD
jgi:hypothetical protein